VTVHFGNIAQPQYRKRLFDPHLAGGVTLDMGCYPVSFLSDILGELPSEVSSSCRLSDTGVDELANFNLTYPSGVLAQVCTSFNLRMRNYAMIYGTEGYIDFPDAQSGESFTIHWHEGTNEIQSSDTLSAKNAENGFVHQVEEVRRCIAAGLTESPGMTLNDSVSLMRIYDGMRNEWGLRYPFE
jgi:predicted dehydrogenase